MTTGEERFLEALREFCSAGSRLAEAWDDGEGFNADERAPLPAALAPPLSLDDWLDALASHYERELEEATR